MEFPLRDYAAMLIKYAEKIKWAADVTPTLCEHRCDSPVMLCDQRRQVGGGMGGGPGLLSLEDNIVTFSSPSVAAALGKQSIANVWTLSHCCQLSDTAD